MLSPAALLFLAGCDAWPLHTHLPEDGVERVAVGDLDGGDAVTWIELPSPLEDGGDDDPRGLTPETLDVAAGNYFTARLTGTGWDPTTPGEPWTDCGDTAAFPPMDNGDYLGDVDWRVVDIESAGTLCSYLRFVEPGAQADVMAYPVNACGLPTNPLVYGSGDAVGYNVAGQVNSWSYPILEPTRLALVAAAWAPNDVSGTEAYLWGVALLASPEDGATGEVVCPAPPLDGGA